MLLPTSAAPMHGAQLVWRLFEDYLASTTFKGDVSESLASVSVFTSFLQSGFRFPAIATSVARSLAHRLLMRMMECVVSAVCVRGPALCQDAVVLHYVYPIVQEYRFGRCWVTRLLRWGGALFVPSILRRVLPSARHASLNDAEDVDIAFLHRPPSPTLRPGDPDVFESMPTFSQSCLRFYKYHYDAHTLYAIVSSGLVSDVAGLLVDQLIWASIYVQERHQRTSLWRFFKRYIGETTKSVAEMLLSYSVRYVGAKLGQRLSSEPTGGGVFWAEHLLLLGCSMQIVHASIILGQWVYDAVDAAYPASLTDLEEDRREQEEHEEYKERAAQWARMSFDAGVAAGARANGFAYSPSTANRLPNYYEMLGVDEKAKPLEIKKAYRSLALQNHPDRLAARDATQARVCMAQLNEAYGTLVDDEKRSQYDATRSLAGTPQIFKSLEQLTLPKLSLVCAATSVGVVFIAYLQFTIAFMRLTSSGRGPIVFASGW